MPLKDEEKDAIAKLVEELAATTVGSGRGKRRIADMFEELVDKETWPDYYELISQPRSINTVLDKLDADEYPDALEAWVDLELIFLNAMHYNKANSQIWKDAQILKDKLGDLWVSKSELPTPPSTPPPGAPGPSKPRIPMPTLLPVPQPTAAPAAPAHRPATSVRAGPSTPAAPRALPVIAPAPKAAPATPMQSFIPAAPSTPLPFARASSPFRAASPDMDVDVGGTPEPEGGVDETARDEEGVAIVQQLERGLPRWQGLGDQGWTWEAPPEKWVDVVLAIKGHKDAVGNRLAPALENIPDNADMPYLSFNYPLSLKIIEQRARDRDFVSSKAFDHEMMRLFEKGRRWWEIGTEQYGHVVLLQRLYQALTGPHPPSGPPYVSQSNFGSLRAGPGSRNPEGGQNAVTSFRVSSKDRTTAEEVHYKGWSFRLADWVHAYNSDDPSKPVMGQVFKAYISDEPGRKGEPGITVCWYYRPEQTVHPAHRQFWENEVFKTSHFADHPLEDIIEKVAVQFTARHIRGRPRPPYWFLGWPLYVCDSRYNDRERVFVKIKNWNSCVPEEVRKSQEFMPIYPFERMVYPRRFDSPFLHGRARGPGGLGDPVDRADGERTEGGGTGRKRSKRPGAVSDLTGPTKGLYVGVPGTVPPGTSAAASGSAAPGTTRAQAASQAQQAAAYVQHQQQLQVQMAPTPRKVATPAPKVEDRSVLTAAGGQAALGANASLEKLPVATTKHFDRDPESNAVLWFAAPPVDVPRAPPPQYSLKYLHWLATKKRRVEERDAGEDGQVKRPRLTAAQRVAAAFAQEMVAERRAVES